MATAQQNWVHAFVLCQASFPIQLESLVPQGYILLSDWFIVMTVVSLQKRDDDILIHVGRKSPSESEVIYV